jgi:hypothetical protein
MSVDEGSTLLGPGLADAIVVHGNGTEIRASLLGVDRMTSTLHQGLVVYGGGGDSPVIVAPTPGGAEAFHLLRDPSSSSTWRWRLAGRACDRLALGASGQSVDILDARGERVGSFSAPGAIDSRGRRFRTQLSVEGSIVTVDAVGLATADYPVLVDPIIEVFTWVREAPPAAPSARFDHAMAYDASRNVVVLFGGNSGGTRQRDTWEWSGSNWSLVSSTGPAVRAGHALAYDPVRARTVLFGGSGGGATHYADTWEWDGVSWTSVGPASSPPARTDHALAYDSVSREVLLFGGWEWFGGSPRYLADTWRWNGTRWQQLTPAGAPGARIMPAMASDTTRNRVVLFGGQLFSGAYSPETWEWDGATWALRTSAGPSARNGHALTFFASRSRTLLYGGWSGAASLDDTWEWDGTSWTSRSPTTRPGARYDHALAYDAARDRAVVFSGNRTSGGTNDTWSLAVASVHTNGDPCTLGAECASTFCVDGVCCENACSGGTADCRACSTAAGGGVNGSCLPVAAGLGLVCRAAAGPCDYAETCGGAATCPADTFLRSDVCRPAVDTCDVAETCLGAGPSCPADRVLIAGSSCRGAAGGCDRIERCDGVSPFCPADGVEALGTPCRSAASACDLPEFCDGVVRDCPANLYRPAGFECRPAVTVCDLPEFCEGTLLCPDQAFLPDRTSCSDGITCNGPELCRGGMCEVSAPLFCDDLDPCTTDMCVEPGGCASERVAGCCTTAVDCDDLDPCTIDSCTSMRCEHTANPGCTFPDAGMIDAYLELDAGRSVEDVGPPPTADATAVGDAGASSDAAPRVDVGMLGDVGDVPGADAGTVVRTVNCGCRASRSRSAGPVALLLAVLLARRRRRV